MGEGAAPLAYMLESVDLTNFCRICKCSANDENGKMRPLFKGRRLTRIIANTIHIEMKDVPGLPRFICEKCVELLKTFSIFQVNFRRSEEDFHLALEAHKHFHMDSLAAFSTSIEIQKQREHEQENAALITNILKKAKKTTKSKIKHEKN